MNQDIPCPKHRVIAKYIGNGVGNEQYYACHRIVEGKIIQGTKIPDWPEMHIFRKQPGQDKDTIVCLEAVSWRTFYIEGVKKE